MHIVCLLGISHACVCTFVDLSSGTISKHQAIFADTRGGLFPNQVAHLLEYYSKSFEVLVYELINRSKSHKIQHSPWPESNMALWICVAHCILWDGNENTKSVTLSHEQDSRAGWEIW